jgi:hypothetical protein
MKKIIMFILLNMTFKAFGQITYSNISYRGTGCPEGTVQTVISEDEESLSILFDEFRSEVPNRDMQDRHVRDRRGEEVSHSNLRSCALSFVAEIPENFKVVGLEVSFYARGSALLDPGVEALFASILVGYQGLSHSQGRPQTLVQKKWRTQEREVSEDFTLNPVAQVNLNSSCSHRNERSIRFDLKNHLKTEITNRDLSKQGLLVLDSIDSRNFFKIKIKKRVCQSSRLAP